MLASESVLHNPPPNDELHNKATEDNKEELQSNNDNSRDSLEKTKMDEVPPSTDKTKVDEVPPSPGKTKMNEEPPSTDKTKVDEVPPSPGKTKMNEEPPSTDKTKVNEVPPSTTPMVEIRGLPQFLHHNFRQFLEYELDIHIVKLIPWGIYPKQCYLTFKDTESADRAVILLDERNWKGNNLTALKPRSYKEIVDARKKEKNLPVEEKVALSVTPYASTPYQEQLVKKQEAAQNILEKIGQELARLNPTIAEFVRWQMIRRKGAVCELDPIIPSPLEDGYRNICEFSIGVNQNTQKITVGFRVGGIKDGNVSVFPVQHLRQINSTMKTVATSFETFLQTSQYPVMDPVTREGVWRRLTVRTSNTGDCLLVVNVNSAKLSEDALAAVKKELQEYCENDGCRVGVTGLFCSSGGSREGGICDVNDHLWGKTYVTETVLGKTFRVSLQSFFRVNTSVAEKLCEAIGDVAELSANDVLVDICSSTGTIGIALAERVIKVFSLEVCETAVADAMHNAQHNNAANVELILGNCDTTLSTVYGATKSLKVKAVIDPPRAGLRNCKVATLIESLRAQEEVSTIVYVACDADKWPQHFQCFVKPMRTGAEGEVFVPVRAVALDLVPHTDKFELILVWERFDETKWQNIMNGTPLPEDEAYFKRVPPAPPLQDYEKLLEEKQKAKAQTPYTGPSANRRRKDRFKNYPYHNKEVRRSRSPVSQVYPKKAKLEGSGPQSSRSGSNRNDYRSYRGGRRERWYPAGNRWGHNQGVVGEFSAWQTGYEGNTYPGHSSYYSSPKGNGGGPRYGGEVPSSKGETDGSYWRLGGGHHGGRGGGGHGGMC